MVSEYVAVCISGRGVYIISCCEGFSRKVLLKPCFQFHTPLMASAVEYWVASSSLVKPSLNSVPYFLIDFSTIIQALSHIKLKIWYETSHDTYLDKNRIIPVSFPVLIYWLLEITLKVDLKMSYHAKVK